VRSSSVADLELSKEIAERPDKEFPDHDRRADETEQDRQIEADPNRPDKVRVVRR